MPPGSGDDEPLSRRELARRAGVSEGTLRNWEDRAVAPLVVNQNSDGSVNATIASLRAFCAAHPKLPAVPRALAGLDAPPPSLDALQTVLSVVLAAVRAATAAHLEIAQNSAAVADNTVAACRAHAAALSTALTSLDDALVQLRERRDSATR